MKIKIKHRYGGEVIFEHSCDDNTMLKTLLAAIDSGADFSGADFSGADFSGADFSGVYFRGANFRYANFSGVDFSGAVNIPKLATAQTEIVPDGAIIGWKQCRDHRIVKLLIPENAKRSNATGRKCRAEFAQVLAIYKAGSDIPFKRATATSHHDYSFIYRIGATVAPREAFSEDRLDECASGIHFFITREEAENY